MELRFHASGPQSAVLDVRSAIQFRSACVRAMLLAGSKFKGLAACFENVVNGEYSKRSEYNKGEDVSCLHRANINGFVQEFNHEVRTC